MPERLCKGQTYWTYGTYGLLDYLNIIYIYIFQLLYFVSLHYFAGPAAQRLLLIHLVVRLHSINLSNFVGHSNITLHRATNCV